MFILLTKTSLQEGRHSAERAGFEGDEFTVKVWFDGVGVEEFFGDAESEAAVTEVRVVEEDIEVFMEDLDGIVFEVSPLVGDDGMGGGGFIHVTSELRNASNSRMVSG